MSNGASNASEIATRYKILRELGSRTHPTYAAVREPRELVVVARFGQANPVEKARGLPPTSLAALVETADSLARNWHANIGRVRHVDASANELAIATEFVDGATLGDLLAKGTLPLPVMVRILLDVLAGLHALHALRDLGNRKLAAVHGELSPANVVVGRDGVARIIHAIRPRPVQIGPRSEALGYAAPETLEGGEVDARSDVFAVGVMLWEALSAKRLFDERDPAKTLARQRVEETPEPTPPADPTLAYLAGIAMRALSFEPGLRYRTAAEMGAELRRPKSAQIASGSVVATWVANLDGERIRGRRTSLDPSSSGMRRRPSDEDIALKLAESARVTVPPAPAQAPVAVAVLPEEEVPTDTFKVLPLEVNADPDTEPTAVTVSPFELERLAAEAQAAKAAATPAGPLAGATPAAPAPAPAAKPAAAKPGAPAPAAAAKPTGSASTATANAAGSASALAAKPAAPAPAAAAKPAAPAPVAAAKPTGSASALAAKPAAPAPATAAMPAGSASVATAKPAAPAPATAAPPAAPAPTDAPRATGSAPAIAVAPRATGSAPAIAVAPRATGSAPAIAVAPRATGSASAIAVAPRATGSAPAIAVAPKATAGAAGAASAKGTPATAPGIDASAGTSTDSAVAAALPANEKPPTPSPGDAVPSAGAFARGEADTSAQMASTPTVATDAPSDTSASVPLASAAPNATTSGHPSGPLAAGHPSGPVHAAGHPSGPTHAAGHPSGPMHAAGQPSGPMQLTAHEAPSLRGFAAAGMAPAGAVTAAPVAGREAKPVAAEISTGHLLAFDVADDLGDEPVARPRRRRGIVVALVAAGLAAFAAGAAFLVVRPSPEHDAARHGPMAPSNVVPSTPVVAPTALAAGQGPTARGSSPSSAPPPAADLPGAANAPAASGADHPRSDGNRAQPATPASTPDAPGVSAPGPILPGASAQGAHATATPATAPAASLPKPKLAPKRRYEPLGI